jgi:hypothetical protein
MKTVLGLTLLVAFAGAAAADGDGFEVSYGDGSACAQALDMEPTCVDGLPQGAAAGCEFSTEPLGFDCSF